MGEANATHPNRDELSAFVGGKLAAADHERVESHVAECDSCCEVLRSLPQESLVRHMRPADTSAGIEETQPGVTAETRGTRRQPSALPVELIDHPRYRIVKPLGAGGMGVVYQAEHRLMKRPVALKVINQKLVTNRVAIERFHLEVRAAAKLAHRNIVTAYDAEQAGDLHFLVMEFVEGTSLSDLVARRGQLSVLHACNYVMQAAQGLQHAAGQGMVHRDIKPQNLMRTPQGTVKILDFGLARLANEIDAARLTRAGVALGTADYIAPEQVEDSRNVDTRADIYSLGCTLYYLLAARVPFPSGTLVDKVLAHLNQAPDSLASLRSDLPTGLIEVVERMMAKQAADRYQTPAEVVEALKPFGKAKPAGGSRQGGGVLDGRGTRGPDAAAGGPEKEREPAGPPVVDAAGVLPPLPPSDPLQFPVTAAPAPGPQRVATPTSGRRDQRRPSSLYLALSAVALLLLAAAAVVLGPPGNGTDDDQDDQVAAGTAEGPEGRGQSTDAAGDPGRDGSTDRWIDLMGTVDPARDAVAGEWQVLPDGLDVDGATNARVALPYDVPAEYDLEVRFTRNSGQHSIAVYFLVGEGQATFEVDAWGEHLAGIQKVGGQTIVERSSSPGPALQNGTMYTALVQVRRGRVRAFLDGQPLATYEGDGSDLEVLDMWRLPTTRSLGVGAYESATRFHCIRLRPVP